MSGIAQRMSAADSRRLTRGEYDAISEIIDAVDRKARELEFKWGIGRLPNIVPLEWSQRFHSQRRKFSEALIDWNVAEATKHGQAMERAYAKLDELASASGASHGPAEQWEFMLDGQLVILVQDRARMGQADRQGRAAQVWSLDEIASVIRNHPILAAAKEAFQGAEVVSIRPPAAVRQQLDDDLEGLPF